MIEVGTLVRVIATGQKGIVASVRAAYEGKLRIVVQLEGQVMACTSADVEELPRGATNSQGNS